MSFLVASICAGAGRGGRVQAVAYVGGGVLPFVQGILLDRAGPTISMLFVAGTIAAMIAMTALTASRKHREAMP